MIARMHQFPGRVCRPPSSAGARIIVEVAGPEDRERIARHRHEVYADELGQHSVNSSRRLEDSLDGFNTFIVARVGAEIAGFVSITPPGGPSYSIDKYFARDAMPFAFDDGLFEVRLLTVLRPGRGREFASLLMYAALRWIEAAGGERVVAIGRREVTGLYKRVGLEHTGLSTMSGKVTFDLMHAPVAAIRARAEAAADVLVHLESRVDWRLQISFRRPAPCFHGGAFFEAIGPGFDTLENSRDIVNADVLDAWFPPAPGVIESLAQHLPWLARTSPPTRCEGLVETIARARGVQPANILPGAGSSDLIFRALRHWLEPSSSVLILDPTYGEYAHVLEKVVGCRVSRHQLNADLDYRIEETRLQKDLQAGHDLVVIVNPNSPTGAHLPADRLQELLRGVPDRTRVWIDETYVEYAGPNQSLEQFAATSTNVIVCKSMSKVYALSGMRVAYLCAAAQQLEALRAITPPWVVGLPAQLAAVRALQDPEYYAARYSETHTARKEFSQSLISHGLTVVPGIANFLLCHLPADGPDATSLAAMLQSRGIFIRNAASMSTRLGPRCVRIAVKDATTNTRIAHAIGEALAKRLG